MPKLNAKPKKILVVRYRFIGDTVLTVPFLRNLSKYYPDAQIDMLIETVSGSFLKYCPYIDNLIEFEDIKSGKKANIFSYSTKLRKEKYDMAFILKRSISSALLCFLAGIPNRIGFDTEKRGLLLSHKIPYDKTKHESESFLDILRGINIPVNDSYLEAWTGKEEIDSINNILQEKASAGSRKVLINASASNINKMWTSKSFAKVIEELTNEFNCQIYFTGTNKDSLAYEEIQKCISTPLKYPLVNLLGKTTILESLELIKRMDLVIGVDSGLLHLSAAANTPTIALFGPMNDQKWAPLGDNNTVLTAPVACRPCNLHKECDKCLVCMTTISPKDVISTAAKYLKKS